MSKLIQSLHIDNLRVNVYEDRSELGKAAATQVANKMRELLAQQEQIRMIFASAPSQNEFLAALVKEPGIEWTRVTAFHMDEYVGLPKNHPASFGRFIEEHLFRFVTPGTIHLIHTDSDTTLAATRYGKLIDEAPIDIVCLGIGENGHIAFNDPGVADFEDPQTMKLAVLDEACRMQQVHDGCFENINAVPKTALTLTVPALCSGRHLFCMVPGVHKQSAVRKTLRGPITPECPASILRQHEDCTLFVDTDSFEEQR